VRVTPTPPLPPIALDPEGVVFDMDGVLCDSEPLWADARFAVAEALGSSITIDDFHAFYGSNTLQWSAGMAKLFNHPDPTHVARLTIDHLLNAYRNGAIRPIPSGIAALRRAAARGPVAVASGSPREVIGTVLELLGLANVVREYVSCDEVTAGKPLPDVYLEACRRIGITPSRSLAIEDSLAGARAGKAAGMTVVLVPLDGAPSSAGAEDFADVILTSLDQLPLAAGGA
jgi:HAD superfamily hydrolase (TIGR01509 family)